MNTTVLSLLPRAEELIPFKDLDLSDPYAIDWNSVDMTTVDPWAVPRDLLNDLTPYGYVPTRALCIFFLAWFGVSTLVHLGQAVHKKRWFMIPTVVLCGAGELIAWGGRYWSSTSPLASDPFLMQIASAVLAPTPLLAALFIIAGIIISQLGPCYSRLSPKMYSIVFLSCDIVSLIVQSVGGGLAASDDENPERGANIMLGGIVFQTVVIIVFCVVSGEFLFRYIKDQSISGKTRERGTAYLRLKLMLAAVIFVLVLLVIRAIYRIIELSEGWEGTVITTEWYFNLFDGAMIALAMTVLNVFHPGYWLLPQQTIIFADDVPKGSTASLLGQGRSRNNATSGGDYEMSSSSRTPAQI
ncbi:RTA1 like protein-domain-containing protein [Pterulicium gracile]|uniref:RTA1 like protein-domain-containing protein n=1 Tax=Pterulicium gracile TaxID=1884261 RepID=A0A5C3QRF4_9AGAR|nr:RTA1 like protein-domain-containing protein [Pterula gracilis]